MLNGCVSIVYNINKNGARVCKISTNTFNDEKQCPFRVKHVITKFFNINQKLEPKKYAVLVIPEGYLSLTFEANSSTHAFSITENNGKYLTM